ncbi:putative spo12-like protein [Erysiphe neolycopersici]|uniref:Putative spo12-like protein n=1 Tax=Erysiphe neolycopersici TaxID=212602 RepID=A0A420I0A6_9PEZI|nr:putative spo12-like protein [Erysiphe neolycopersici]
MSTNVLTNRDVNTKNSTSPCKMDIDRTPEYLSMEYHRKIFQSKTDENQLLAQRQKATYVSPSDTIMSPCTAKLSAYRNKQVGKAKPKSLFAKTSSKSIGSSGNFFASPTSKDNTSRVIGDTMA